MSPEPLLYLSEVDVTELCQSIDPLAIVEHTFRRVAQGAAGVTAEAALRWTAPDGSAARSLVLPANSGINHGCKIINSCLGNLDRGLPRAHGLIVLHDYETAAPTCIMEGGAISALRTAAVSAVAVRALRDVAAVRTIGVLGCGRQAATHLNLLTPLCANLRHVLAFDLDVERARHFADSHSREIGIHVADQAEAAVRGAELIVAVTTTTTPYVQLDWLQPGATFLNVSLDDATQELLLGSDHLIVDDWNLVRNDHHRLLGRLAQAGKVTGPTKADTSNGHRVDADLAAVVSGRYERRVHPHHRVVINPFGMGVHDIAIAAEVQAEAARSGKGMLLPR
ncbi:ornithine cyclodeaminase [Micromonospora sp. DH14]|uniref:ornithine cyclodeaminase n=1 Tax=Micromonospora sp. DH14 TaxID=3040120 RepID=UPI0024418C22|nr:ornithine cyclodeaminase [Micromonospora sp. DH14]MDG9674810.1 ornithine cyclodeaminase [Micromonospora sp. DH14]